jgi:hypothetical protein
MADTPETPVPRPRTEPIPAASTTATGPIAAERRPRWPWRAAPAVRLLVWIVNVATTVVVGILVLNIIFVVFKSNGANTIVHDVGVWADHLVWRFKDMFLPSDHRVAVLVNYGIAAIVYLIVGRIVIGMIRRLG